MKQTQEVQVWSLSQEDPLEKEMATHSSILAWKISLLAGSVNPGKWDLHSTIVDKNEQSLLPSLPEHTSLSRSVLPAPAPLQSSGSPSYAQSLILPVSN